MDPSAALRNACAAAADMLAAEQDGDDEAFTDAASELLDAFSALNGWITGGGFLPAEWDRNR